MTIEINKTIKVSDVSAARKLILDALEADKCHGIQETETSISAKRGSQIEMRTLGGMFVDAKVLPVSVTVDLQENELNITAEDDLGIGFMIGMETKYHEAVQDIVKVIEEAVLSLQ
ncbi:hypothetical protein M2113_000616 [Aurantimicrobium minutum]|jgi:hypothetical protein|uniref:hypothetical protein n=1 Tax=Aurantimicrobium minutum TaxID=708131 RepID=UPI002473D8AC|nr:hypothetical protein [Aurantimicrobium minutum]MDH6409655.1 hypothetical protein [Aurantimicrobium minutum]